MEETSIKDAVEVRNLVKVYDGKTRGLDGIDLEVKTGIAFVLIDRSSSYSLPLEASQPYQS